MGSDRCKLVGEGRGSVWGGGGGEELPRRRQPAEGREDSGVPRRQPGRGRAREAAEALGRARLGLPPPPLRRERVERVGARSWI